MKTPVDDRLITEARHYRLQLFCEDCAHFQAETQACAEGYPNDEHRRVPLDESSRICFCKSFELC